MTRSLVSIRYSTLLALAILLTVSSSARAQCCEAPKPSATGAAMSASAAFDRMKSLVGDWVDADGSMGMKGQVAVSYRMTGGGTAVMETLFAGTPHEMLTVYYRDGDALVATHYCSSGNQPHLRAKTITADSVDFDFDGGTNVDPSKDAHIHSAHFQFLSADEIHADWLGWSGGKEDAAHAARFHLARKKA